MRVLIATDSFPPGCGGSGWSTWELVTGLTGRGHVVTVVQPRPGAAPGLRTREYEGCQVVEVGAWAPDVPYVRNYFKNERLTRILRPVLVRLVQERGIELVHAQHVLSGPAAIDAACQMGRPVVCTVRDYWPLCYWSTLLVDPGEATLCPGCTAGMMAHCVRPRAGRAWPLALPLIPYMMKNLARKRATLARADAVVAVSAQLEADLRARAPEVSATRLERIPNPVNLAAACAAADRPAPLEGPYAIYVGKLAPNKGSAWLPDIVRQAQLPWPLVVVGDGPDRSRIEAGARASHLDIRLTGWLDRDEALTWLAHAAVVVFPSHGPESLSRVLLEAGALARPIAAMDTGGTRDVIEHARTGLLSSTPEALARDLARLVADPDLRARLGAALRAHVSSEFDATGVVARIEALYARVLAARGRRRG